MSRLALAKKFWDRSSFLSIKNEEYRNIIIHFLDSKIKEDTKNQDTTTRLLIKKEKTARAVLRAKQDCIITGLEEVVFYLRQKKINVVSHTKDGEHVKNGSVILKIRGNAHTILAIERTILNVIQRMSGIATKTNELSKKAKDRCFIAGTRKTLLDYFDKKAVSVGGGLTHRLNLHDSILIKDNHLTLLGHDIKKAVQLAAKSPGNIEIEIKNETEALSAAAQLSKISNNGAIMFDNMPPITIQATIKRIKNETKKIILFEASGGINESNLAHYSRSGVDVISLGLLTHSVKACDFSLKIQ